MSDSEQRAISELRDIGKAACAKKYIELAAARQVPEHLQDGLGWYIADARPVGGFLTAVLSGDLMQTYARADARSIAGLPSLVWFLVNDAPHACCGSEDKMRTWPGVFNVADSKAALNQAIAAGADAFLESLLDYDDAPHCTCPAFSTGGDHSANCEREMWIQDHACPGCGELPAHCSDEECLLHDADPEVDLGMPR